LWQLVTGIHDESDGLKLCEWHSEGYDHIHCCPFSVGFAGTDRMYSHSVVVEASLQSAGYPFVQLCLVLIGSFCLYWCSLYCWMFRDLVYKSHRPMETVGVQWSRICEKGGSTRCSAWSYLDTCWLSFEPISRSAAHTICRRASSLPSSYEAIY
jgi:hypothetical protein